eukprot:NODE_12_length_54577_cov_0.384100.p8 type:complete len:428 gc:universal NODE_12_length_54577_cov_0.384100:22785-21502(-)
MIADKIAEIEKQLYFLEKANESKQKSYKSLMKELKMDLETLKSESKLELGRNPELKWTKSHHYLPNVVQIKKEGESLCKTHSESKIPKLKAKIDSASQKCSSKSVLDLPVKRDSSKIILEPLEPKTVTKKRKIRVKALEKEPFKPILVKKTTKCLSKFDDMSVPLERRLVDPALVLNKSKEVVEKAYLEKIARCKQVKASAKLPRVKVLEEMPFVPKLVKKTTKCIEKFDLMSVPLERRLIEPSQVRNKDKDEVEKSYLRKLEMARLAKGLQKQEVHVRVLEESPFQVQLEHRKTIVNDKRLSTLAAPLERRKVEPEKIYNKKVYPKLENLEALKTSEDNIIYRRFSKPSYKRNAGFGPSSLPKLPMENYTEMNQHNNHSFRTKDSVPPSLPKMTIDDCCKTSTKGSVSFEINFEPQVAKKDSRVYF